MTAPNSTLRARSRALAQGGTRAMSRPHHRQRRGGATASPFDLLSAAQRVAESTATIIPALPRDVAEALDARGYPRAVATTREFHLGREPRNKGKTFPPDPPSVTEIMAMLRACGPDPYGRRLYAAIILMYQGALRAFEALAITEADLDDKAGRLQIRHGKGDKRATITMAAWAWPFLDGTATSTSSSRPSPSRRGSRSGCRATRCATPARRTCTPPASISAPSSSTFATRTSGSPTPTCAASGWTSPATTSTSSRCRRFRRRRCSSSSRAGRHEPQPR